MRALPRDFLAMQCVYNNADRTCHVRKDVLAAHAHACTEVSHVVPDVYTTHKTDIIELAFK